MYLRSPEEHWEYDCKVIEKFIEDPADRKYVDFAYAQILHKQVFSTKMPVVLEPPLEFNQELFDKRKKKGANDGYFMKKGTEYAEKMETQKDAIRVIIENMEKMGSMRMLVAHDFERAKMRYAKLRNPAKGWEPPKMTIVICPHCGEIETRTFIRQCSLFRWSRSLFVAHRTLGKPSLLPNNMARSGCLSR